MSIFRHPFGSQRGNGSWTLLKSGWHHLYTSVPLTWDKSSRKKFLSVTSKMLGLFVNNVTADEMYSLHKRDNFQPQIQTNIFSKTKDFFCISHCISEFYVKFWVFFQKRWVSELKYFWNEWVRKRWLLKCLQCPFLTGPKDCWNLHGTTFILPSH